MEEILLYCSVTVFSAAFATLHSSPSASYVIQPIFSSKE